MRFPDEVPVLTDGVVTLRAHAADDVRGIFEQCTDPVVHLIRFDLLRSEWVAEQRAVTAR